MNKQEWVTPTITDLGCVLSFTIDKWPQSVNHSYFTTKMGARVQTAKAKAWMDYAVITLMDQHQTHSGHMTIKLPVRVWIDLYQPDRGVFDVDNYGKNILDALKEANIIYDDSLVHELHLRKYIPISVKSKAPLERYGEVDIRLNEI